MFEIEIADTQSVLQLDPARLREIVCTTLAAEQVCGGEIAVGIMDDATIHEVNRTHLQHDYPTDVISFLYHSEVDHPELREQSPLRGAGLILEGEILISTETAVREAEKYGWDATAEVTLYLVHGLLHLCGYDDLSEEEQEIMRRRERDILQIWNLSPHYDW